MAVWFAVPSEEPWGAGLTPWGGSGCAGVRRITSVPPPSLKSPLITVNLIIVSGAKLISDQLDLATWEANVKHPMFQPQGLCQHKI